MYYLGQAAGCYGAGEILLWPGEILFAAEENALGQHEILLGTGEILLGPAEPPLNPAESLLELDKILPTRTGWLPGVAGHAVA